MASITFRSFAQWKEVCLEKNVPLFQPVLDYELDQKGNDETVVFTGLAHAFSVMEDAVHTGLTQDMKSRSGMVQGGAKKVHTSAINVLTHEFRE